jgi:hypothetical protein
MDERQGLARGPDGARTEWHLEAESFGNCNCDYSCPCQFELRPSQGNCRGIEALRITKGNFGPTRLDGLCAVLTYAWPGAVYEGEGEMQAIIDTRADAEQRVALGKILHGEETDEGANHWWVFRAMCRTVHPPIFAPIEFEVDVTGRRARLRVPDLLESEGRPIVSPATGREHRIRIDLPCGIEFDVAEIGSGKTRALSAVPISVDDTYGQFNYLRHSSHGPVRGR